MIFPTPSSVIGTLPFAPHPSMRSPGTTRRGFLRKLVFAQAPAVAEPGGHTLVCIFLRGGADTLNMVVPFGDGDYYRYRPTLSIAAPGRGPDAAVKLDNFYGLHPKMVAILPVFKEGRLGIVQAVGSDNPTGSHFEAQDQIEHGETYGINLGGGWLGRHLRARAGNVSSPLAGIAIGETLPESLRGAPAACAFSLDRRGSTPRLGGESGLGFPGAIKAVCHRGGNHRPAGKGDARSARPSRAASRPGLHARGRRGISLRRIRGRPA